MTTVVTSFSPAGFLEYGRRFLDTFAEHWPAEVKLVCYREGDEDHPRAEMRDLLAIPACAQFLDRHRGQRDAAGRAPMPCWKSKEREDGYSFRTDAMKFCRKPFAVADAARRLDWDQEEVLIWCDADVVTLRQVPLTLAAQALGPCDVAFLGRERMHSECGFLAFRLPQTWALIEGWEGAYRGDWVFRLPEWHDSFVFDFVRSRLPEIAQANLTPGGEGHVWCDSMLAPYLDHLKGDRKRLGYSPERRGR